MQSRVVGGQAAGGEQPAGCAARDGAALISCAFLLGQLGAGLPQFGRKPGHVGPCCCGRRLGLLGLKPGGQVGEFAFDPLAEGDGSLDSGAGRLSEQVCGRTEIARDQSTPTRGSRICSGRHMTSWSTCLKAADVPAFAGGMSTAGPSASYPRRRPSTPKRSPAVRDRSPSGSVRVIRHHVAGLAPARGC